MHGSPQHARPALHKRLVLVILAAFALILTFRGDNDNRLALEDAFFLTRNSLKELKQTYLTGTESSPRTEVADIDYPLNNAVNSFLPIDASIQYNTTERSGNITTHDLQARYAAFSPILNHQVRGRYHILTDGACSPVQESSEHANKILVVMRGNCTFVEKVTNILSSDLKPLAVVVANDEPSRGLITMFSNTFNQDGSLRVPVMFVSFESYQQLQAAAPLDIELAVATASFGSWLSIMLSMILSPPLLILIFYLVIMCGQNIRRRQANVLNSKLVQRLTVYVFNNDHLIEASWLPQYLKITGQSTAAPKDDSPAESPAPSTASSTSQLNKIIINGIDIREAAQDLHVLTAPGDFYPSYKCSICLDKYTPLHSRVLILECKHFYHERCLSNWLINFKRSCPLCNTVISAPSDSLLAGQDRAVHYGSTDDDLEAQHHPLTAPIDFTYVGDDVDHIFGAESHEDARNYTDTDSHEYRDSHDSNYSHDYNDANDYDDTSQGLPRGSFHSSLVDYPNEYPTAALRYPPSHSHSAHSQASETTSFYSAASEPATTTPPAATSSRRFYAKPSHILSQFSSASTLNQANARDLSVSIDTSHFVTPPGSPHATGGVTAGVPQRASGDSPAGSPVRTASNDTLRSNSTIRPA